MSSLNGFRDMTAWMKAMRLSEPMMATCDFAGDARELMRQMGKVLDRTFKIRFRLGFQSDNGFTTVGLVYWFMYRHFVYVSGVKKLCFKELPDGTIRSNRMHKAIARLINQDLQWGIKGRVTKRLVMCVREPYMFKATKEPVFEVCKTFKVVDEALMRKHLHFIMDPTNNYLVSTPDSGENVYGLAIDKGVRKGSEEHVVTVPVNSPEGTGLLEKSDQAYRELLDKALHNNPVSPFYGILSDDAKNGTLMIP